MSLDAAIAPTQSNVLVQLRAFLIDVLPDGVAVLAGQINRVPEDAGDDFVIMTPIRMTRLRTNVDGFADVSFQASITGTTMTVTEVFLGSIAAGAALFGPGVSAGSKVGAQQSGTPGGIGVYDVTPSQTVGAAKLASGAKTMEQGAEVAVQLDFHSKNFDAGDLAMTVSTAFRDAYAVDQFAAQDPNYGVVPLLADDPRQMPFFNEAQQVEWRWTLDALLQSNLVVSVPQQFADSLAVELVDVDAAYPPT